MAALVYPALCTVATARNVNAPQTNPSLLCSPVFHLIWQINEFTHQASLNHCLLLTAFLIKTDSCSSLALYSLVIMSQTHIKSGRFNREKPLLPTVKVIHLYPEPSGSYTTAPSCKKCVLAPGAPRWGSGGSFSGSGFYSHFSLHIFRCDSIRRDSVAFVGTILGCPRSSSRRLYNRLLQRGIYGLFHLCRSNFLPVVCSYSQHCDSLWPPAHN